MIDRLLFSLSLFFNKLWDDISVGNFFTREVATVLFSLLLLAMFPKFFLFAAIVSALYLMWK